MTRRHNYFTHRSVAGDYREKCLRAADLHDRHGVECHFIGERFGVDRKSAARMVQDGRAYAAGRNPRHYAEARP